MTHTLSNLQVFQVRIINRRRRRVDSRSADQRLFLDDTAARILRVATRVVFREGSFALDFVLGMLNILLIDLIDETTALIADEVAPLVTCFRPGKNALLFSACDSYIK